MYVSSVSSIESLLFEVNKKVVSYNQNKKVEVEVKKAKVEVKKADTYGPWTPTSVLCDENNKKILGIDSSWVIKVKSNKCIEELTDILSFIRCPVRNMVEVPREPYQQFGITADSVWFAMKRYDGHLTRAHAHMWKTVATSCIAFLRDLHCLHRKVYMDFRMENILVSGNTVVVADYELVTDVSSKKTCDYPVDTRWYFMARGAEPNKRLYSWRQDLVSLGYILLLLTTKPEDTPFYMDFLMRRLGVRKNHHSTRSLVRKRNRCVAALANPILTAYFEKIKEVSWNDWLSPYSSFYKELSALFD